MTDKWFAIGFLVAGSLMVLGIIILSVQKGAL